MKIEIVKERLKELENLTLAHGGHTAFEKGVCALEAAAYLAGEKHSDHPECVCPVIAGMLRRWNDDLPNDAERNRLIKPLLPKILGTRVKGAKKGDPVLLKRMWMALDWQIRVYAPAFLKASGIETLQEGAAALAALEPIVDMRTLETAATPAKSAQKAAAAAWAAAGDAAGAAAGDAAWAAARDAARDAAGAAARAAAGAAARDAAGDAARAAAGAAARAAAWAAAGDAAGDAAWAAARDAARDAIRVKFGPTVGELQLSMVALIERMCEVQP